MDTGGKILVSVSAVLALVLGAWLVRAGVVAGKRARVRDVSGIETAVWVASALVVFLAPVVGGAVGARVLGVEPGGGMKDVRTLALALGCQYAAGVVVAIAVVLLLRGRGERVSGRAGLRARWSDVGWGLACLLVVLPFYLLVSQASVAVWGWLRREAPSAVQHDVLGAVASRGPGEAGWVAVLAVAVTVGAPVVEEVVYRVCAQSALLRATNGAWRGWAAVLATSVVFAGMHASVVPGSALAPLLVLSVGLGLAYERTGRLGVPVVMHIGFNAVNFAVVWLGWVG